MGRDTFHQTRLLKALSSLGLNTAREGADRASRGNLCQCLTTFIVYNFFLIPSLNLLSFSFEPLPLVLLLNALVKIPLQLSCRSWTELLSLPSVLQTLINSMRRQNKTPIAITSLCNCVTSNGHFSFVKRTLIFPSSQAHESYTMSPPKCGQGDEKKSSLPDVSIGCGL